MVRESFVFFKSFWEAIQEIPDDKDKLDCLTMIMQYGLYGDENSDIKGLPKAVFSIAKPVIDSIAKRYNASVENGKKGGRPKENKEPNKNLKKPNKNPKVNAGLNLKKPNHNLNDNDNVNDNVNDNEKKKEKGENPSRFSVPWGDLDQTQKKERWELMTEEERIAKLRE